MTRKQALEHLATGRTLFSATTGIYYKRIRGVLHKRVTYSSTMDNTWQPSMLQFKNPDAARSMRLFEETS